MRKGWYRGRDVILRVFDYGELPAEDARARKLGLVWAQVFEPSAGAGGLAASFTLTPNRWCPASRSPKAAHWM